MTNKAEAAASVPVFETEAEERLFGETHAGADWLDGSAGRRVVLPKLKPGTPTISLRPPQHLLDHRKTAANARDVPCQSPTKVWRQEKLTTG